MSVGFPFAIVFYSVYRDLMVAALISRISHIASSLPYSFYSCYSKIGAYNLASRLVSQRQGEYLSCPLYPRTEAPAIHNRGKKGIQHTSIDNLPYNITPIYRLRYSLPAQMKCLSASEHYQRESSRFHHFHALQ